MCGVCGVRESVCVSDCVCVCLCAQHPLPGPHRPNSYLVPSGSRTRDSHAGGGRSNKERQRLQPLVSVARVPLFEVRGVRFTLTPRAYTSVTCAFVFVCVCQMSPQG